MSYKNVEGEKKKKDNKKKKKDENEIKQEKDFFSKGNQIDSQLLKFLFFFSFTFNSTLLTSE